MIELCLTNLGKYNEGELEAFGRDMEINGSFVETESGYIEIYH